MPKLKTSTDSKSLIVKSSKTDEEYAQGLLQSELKEGAHHFTLTGRF
jgi:hypothetical protein